MEDLIRSRDFRNGHWSDVVRFVPPRRGCLQPEAKHELAERAERSLPPFRIL